MIAEQRSISKRKIQQIRLLFSQQYAPYKYMTPYFLLGELNKVVKSKYDIEFVHVKYLLNKNRNQKDPQTNLTSEENFHVDKDFNNIFDKENKNPNFQSMIDFIFNKAQRLKPPSDFNPEDEEKIQQNQLKEFETKRLVSIQNKIKDIMKIFNEKDLDKDENIIKSTRSIQRFKTVYVKEFFSNNQYSIFAKAIMNQPVFQKLRQDFEQKNNKTMIEIKYKDITFKIHINPKNEQDSIQRINEEYLITNWSLNTLYEDKFFNYFGTDLLEEKVKKINGSIKFASSVSFNQMYDNIQSFAITTYLWNETVLKIVVKMAQIKKIERTKSGDKYEYYFYLTYPPMYYINELKKDEANSEKYMKFTDRVTNFAFLNNKEIENNYFLRYFLFNNSNLRISVDLSDKTSPNLSGYISSAEAFTKLQAVCKKFEGTIQSTYIPQPYKRKLTLRFLAGDMDFQSFMKQNKIHLSKQIQDKFWMIKYLILVMVRYNYIIPTATEIGPIMNCIENEKNLDYIDCYLYVLWRTATNVWGYKNEKKRFFEYFQEESEQVKKTNVKNIMKRMLQESDSIVHILRVSLTPSGYLFNPPTPQMKGRLLKQYVKYSQFFLRVSLTEENEIELKNQKYITRIFFRKHLKEIEILNRSYLPLGWSPSQLRAFSLWYVHEINGRNQNKLEELRRRHILEFLGDFREIENPAKKAARIGQSFSSSWTYSGKNIKEQTIEDKYSGEGVCFTDGIGKISADLLQKISIKLNIRDLSVIQIRYKGAKGVLALDPSLKKNTIHLRKSMIKFKCYDERVKQYLDILDWNKYKAGFLNRQVIILLRTLGINEKIFMRLQTEHIAKISKMTFRDCSIFKYMGDMNTDINNLEPATKTILSLLNAGFALEKEPFFRGVLETLKKNGYHQLKIKANINVDASARLIGIVDEDEILGQGEIYCSIYDHFAVKPKKQIRNERAIITRNPCLDPADIRIVQCVGQSEIKQRFEKIGKINKFEQMWNVVVFPVKGKYPLTSQISGSDLDGDNFFVCWDERLIPVAADPPNLIDGSPSQNKNQQKSLITLSEEETYQKMLDFFIDYTNYEKLGQIDNSHLIHADRDLINHANNEKCKKLAKIHGKAVDFPKTGYCPPVDSGLFCNEYPDFMEKQNVKTYMSQSILGKLYRDIKGEIQNLINEQEYKGSSQIDDNLIFDFNFEYSPQELKKCLILLRQYERQIGNLINLVGVDTQYEIYSGNFSTVKNNVKTFGKNRLVATILGLRERFFEAFFQQLPSQDEQKYKNNGYYEQHMKKPQYFSYQTRRKAQLYYLVSYIRKFPDIKFQLKQSDEINQTNVKHLNKMKKDIEQTLQQLKVMANYEKQKYCGFVWFVIPKIILNLKITYRASLKIEEPNGEQELSAKEDQEDEEYI